MNKDEFENFEKNSQFIKNGIIKDELPASFNQQLMRKIRKEDALKPEFTFFGLRPVYAMVTLLLILSIAIFFIAPFKNKTITTIPNQTAISFTDEDHLAVENILLASNGTGEDEVLMDLFTNK